MRRWPPVDVIFIRLCQDELLRQADPRRGKGERGGLRVIYYWWSGGDQFWLFAVYDKDQADDLTPTQRKVLKQLLKNELKNRQPLDGEHDDQ